MSDELARLVMKAAATELLYDDAAQIDQEVRWLLAEMEHAPASECRGILLQRFLDLLQRRGEVAKKALIMRDDPEARATFTDQIWPFVSKEQFDTSPSPSIGALSSEDRVVTPAAKTRAPTKSRPACDAGNRAISRLHRPAEGSAGLSQDGCRDMRARRAKASQGNVERKAAQLLRRVSSQCSARGDQRPSDQGARSGGTIEFARTCGQ
jgi:hypothetical protein